MNLDIVSVYYYFINLIPIVLPLLWIMGALIFFFKEERKNDKLDFEEVNRIPVSILIPCYNEEMTVTATIKSLDHLDLKQYEVIAVNDGSKDSTLNVLEDLASTRPHLRIVNLMQNRGKAAALSIGLMSAKYKYILCIDADSELDRKAPLWMLHHFRNPDVAAVTGNPRVKNRGTLIGQLQVGEFSALVGMIKRYHQSIGKLFALSGVLVMFRKSAVESVGLWDTDSVTEDIAISWKLQTAGWKIKYEPHAICDVLMPDTLKGLWKQRLRWAQGGAEVVSKYGKEVLKSTDKGLKLILLEYLFSVLWAFALPLTVVLTLSHLQTEKIVYFYWEFSIFLTGIMSFLQFTIGYFLHWRYERKLSLGLWIIWYPFIYWMLNTFVLFVAIPKVVFSKRQKFSTWISPDRGGITYAKNI